MELKKDSIEFIKKEMARYETKRSAILPCLYRMQEDCGGWVPPEAVEALAKVMDIPDSMINEVLTFYTMYNKEKVGKFHVQVCTNISCSMNGGRELADHLCKVFGVEYDEISKDGRFTVSRVECLGSCDTAPMMQVNDNYYENLTHEKAEALLRKME